MDGKVVISCDGSYNSLKASVGLLRVSTSKDETMVDVGDATNSS